MVNVLVAFAMLMIVCGFFYRAVTLSLNMTQKAEEIRQSAESALESYYAAGGAGAEQPLACTDGSDGFTLVVKPGVYTDAETGRQFCYYYK